jgi:hypothetical protein
MSMNLSWRTARAIGGGFLLLSLFVVGCGQKAPAMRPGTPFGNTTQAEREKISGNLEAAGIKGELLGVVDDDKQYIVEVGTPKPPPGVKPTAPPPVTYLVDKASGKVTGTGMQ